MILQRTDTFPFPFVPLLGALLTRRITVLSCEYIAIFSGVTLGFQHPVPQMSSEKTVHRDEEHREVHPYAPDARPLLFRGTSNDIFGEFFNEFEGDTRTLFLERRDNPSLCPPFVDRGEQGCQRRDSNVFALCANTSASLVDESRYKHASSHAHARAHETCPTGGGSSSSSSGAIPRADPRPSSSKAETPQISCASEALAKKKKGTIVYSSTRKLTNTTYLRRLNLSRDVAASLFPEVQRTMEVAFTSGAKRLDASENLKRSTSVSIQDPEGRRWPVVLECLFTAGQRHVRLTRGWHDICSSNGVSVGETIRFDRWEKQGKQEEVLVTVSIEAVYVSSVHDQSLSSN